MPAPSSFPRKIRLHFAHDVFPLQVFGFVSMNCFLMISYLLLIYSFERYSFLCHPIGYNTRITKTRIFLALLTALAICTVLNELVTLSNRAFTITGLTCVARNILLSTSVLTLFFVVPTMSVVAFSVVNIKRLQSRYDCCFFAERFLLFV